VNRVTWLGHSTVVIEIDGTRLVTDPALRSRIWHLRRRRRSALRARRARRVLVSHAHFDHLDLGSLDKLDRSLPVVVPGKRASSYGGAGLPASSRLQPGRARPRQPSHPRHARRTRFRAGPFSPQSSALGYVVTGSASVYFAGDTDLFDGWRSLARWTSRCCLCRLGRKIAGGASRSASGGRGASAAAPASRCADPLGTFRAPFAPRHGPAPARDFARAAALVAPEVKVHMLQIGGSLALVSDGTP